MFSAPTKISLAFMLKHEKKCYVDYLKNETFHELFVTSQLNVNSSEFDYESDVNHSRPRLACYSCYPINFCLEVNISFNHLLSSHLL